MRRGLLTLLVTTALCGAYRAYSQLVSPLTQASVVPLPPLSIAPAAAPASFAARSAAETFLADARWAREAKYEWQRGEEAFLYANSLEPIDDGETNKVRIKPFALIWRDPRRHDEPPLVLTANSARITFQHGFDQKSLDLSGDPGRIVGAALEGTVSLRGPDGLLLDGANFTFSEERLTLYSDENLEFAYGPTASSPSRFAGSAHGISINLKAGTENVLGDNLPRITDFEHLTLYSKVLLNILFDDHGTPSPVNVESDGPLEFDRQTRLASFEKNVRIRRQALNPDGRADPDWLKCHRLELYFDEESGAAAVAGSATGDAVVPNAASRNDAWKERQNAFSSLRFHYLRALGLPARNGAAAQKASLASPSNDLTAEMDELLFDAFERLLSINDATESQLDFGPTRLLTRRLLVGLDEQQHVVLAHCNGPGVLEHRAPENQQLLLTSRWTSAMEFRADPENSTDPANPDRLTELTGQVEVLLADGSGLNADRLRLWLLDSAMAQLEPHSALPRQPLDLPLRRLLAEGHVGFTGSSAVGHDIGRLDVTVQEGRPPAIQSSRPPNAGEPGQAAAHADDPLWQLTADRVTALVIVDPATRQMGAADVVAEDHIRFERDAGVKQGGPYDGAIVITGRRLHVVNEGGSRQVLTLQGTEGIAGRAGEPAAFRSGATRLEGQKIEVDRNRPQVTVTGHPVLQWPVDADLMGHPLPAAQLLNIECRDKLTFDGSRAEFFKLVRVSLDQSRLYCDQIIATLDQPVSLVDPPASAIRPEIREIECLGRPKIEMYEFNARELVRNLEGEIGRFRVNLKSGDFSGLGPGDIKEWKKGGMQLSFAPTPSAAANRPAESTELPWAFVNLQFSGRFSGNLNQRYGQIERAQAIYAPVDKVDVQFTRQDLSRRNPTSERAVWMGCDMLNILLTDSEIENGPYFVTLEADGHSQLEGRTVYANAHQISFDQAKDQLILRGRGHEKASIYLETDEGAASNRYSAAGRTIWVEPSSRTVNVDGAGTLR